MSKQPFSVAKSYTDGRVTVRGTFKASGYGASVKIECGQDITTEAARQLAGALVEAADLADAKVAKKTAEDVRRKEWRDREIAAGRMKIFTPGEFFG